MLSFQPLKTIVLSALPLHTVFLQAPFLPSFEAIRGEQEKGNLANGSKLLNVCENGRLSCISVTLTSKITSSYPSGKSITHYQANYYLPKWFAEIRLYVGLLGRKRHPRNLHHSDLTHKIGKKSASNKICWMGFSQLIDMDITLFLNRHGSASFNTCITAVYAKPRGRHGRS